MLILDSNRNAFYGNRNNVKCKTTSNTRGLIKPLNHRVQHIKFVLLKRFLSFIQQIINSSKNASKFLLKSLLMDTNSVTGSNLRNILLLTEKNSIHQLEPTDITLMKYHQISEAEVWKISMLEELIEMKNGNIQELTSVMMN